VPIWTTGAIFMNISQLANSICTSHRVGHPLLVLSCSSLPGKLEPNPHLCFINFCLHHTLIQKRG
jgi:hypothetical protein